MHALGFQLGARAQGAVPWETFVTQLLPSGQVFVGVATRNWPAPNSVLSGQLLPGTLAGRCVRLAPACRAAAMLEMT